MATADEIVRVGLQWENIESSLNQAIQQAQDAIKSGLNKELKLSPEINSGAIQKIQSQLKSVAESMHSIKMDSNASKTLTSLVQQLNRVPKVTNFEGLVSQLQDVQKAAKLAHSAIDSISKSSDAVKNLGVNGNGTFPAEVKIDFGKLEQLSTEVAKSVSTITSEVKSLTTALQGVQKITGSQKRDVSAVKQDTENLKAIAAQEKAIAAIEKGRASAAKAQAEAEKAANDWYEQMQRAERLLNDPNSQLSSKNMNGVDKGISALQSKYNKTPELFDETDTAQRIAKLKTDFESLQTALENVDFGDAAQVQTLITQYERLKQEVRSVAEAMNNAATTAQNAKLQASNTSWSNMKASYDTALAQAQNISSSKIGQYATELKQLKDEAQKVIDSLGETGTATASQLDTASKKIDGITKKITKLQDNSKYDRSNTKGIFYELSQTDSLSAKMQSIAAGYGTLIQKSVQYSDTARKWSGTVQTQSGQLIQLKASADTAGNGFRVLATNMSEAQSAAHRVGVSFSEIAKNYLSYFSGQQLVTKLMSQLSEGWQQIQELDKSYTELDKVSDESTAALRAFQSASFDIANQSATTGKAIQDSAADWMRLGYAIKDASEFAKNTSIYANVGEMDIDTATEHMISSVKAFNKDFASDAEASAQIADIYNEIDNNFSITAEGIGEGMERAGAALVAANNDIYQSVAMLTAGNEIMQNPELMGNTLKVLSMRIRGAKTELAEAGEETDGMAESTAKLRAQIKALSGVDIMKDANTFKATYDIMDELADKWSSLSDIKQASLLETIAGVCPLCAEMYTKFAFNCR